MIVAIEITEKIKDLPFLCSCNENIQDGSLDGNVSLMSTESLHRPQGIHVCLFCVNMY